MDNCTKEKFWQRCLLPLILVTGALFIFWLGIQSASQNAGTRFPHRFRAKKVSAIGMGYVRGSSRVILRNKNAGFVTKVNFYDQDKVRKGDVILEYDDLPWREAVTDKRNNVAELEKTLKQTEVELARVMLDPVPDAFRNLEERRTAAKSKLLRLSHEDQVYQKLKENHSVSDLAQREKHQELLAAKAEYDELVNNQKKLEEGLSELYVQKVQREVERLKTLIEDEKEELVLLQEEQKYYRIVAPWDGICITHSDTVHGYNAAGTAAAEVHAGAGKYVYAYVEEDLLGHVTRGRHYRFRSADYDCDEKGFAELELFDATKEHNSRGNKCYHLVKFRVVKEAVPLRIDSIGQIELM